MNFLKRHVSFYDLEVILQYLKWFCQTIENSHQM